ncbi:CvfB family protein [Flammeovirga agarivorans]|uniref:GntR family transcriptional regulator n=1 Tax=Flammeovirga agarivorans TaxID=2726742 RepID=A0A7X8SLT7_9BACT|nr:S1-like domain-containing RNA-binding protein [Flammeovirga agarivorans]NLR92594.1 GntR family transcriptional regulator [Flammeovirga agarivorans]
MNKILVGSYNDLEVSRITDFGYFFSTEEGDVFMPIRLANEELKVGETTTVFIYTDNERRWVATHEKPKGIVGEFTTLECKDTNKNGAFLDWGISKDLFVPFSEQSATHPMRKKKTYTVYVDLDRKTGRVFATSKLHKHLNTNTSDFSTNQEVFMYIAQEVELGYECIVNRKWLGLLYKNQIYSPLKLGKVVKGYISNIRPDGKLDLTTARPGYHEESIEKTAKTLLLKMKKTGGFIPFNDKSHPAEIKKEYKMSKKQFKQILGYLYKMGVVKFTAEGTELVDF